VVWGEGRLLVRSAKGGVAVSDAGDGLPATGRRPFSANMPFADPGSGVTRKAVVEIRINHGGSRSAACLGGRFDAGGDEFILELADMSEPATSVPAFRMVSDLGSDLIVGLPTEYVSGAFVGLVDAATILPLPSGRLRVDIAAHDLTDSSLMAFRLTAGLLTWVLCANESVDEITSAGLDEQLSTWRAETFRDKL
jgi:hypothetical protein